MTKEPQILAGWETSSTHKWRPYGTIYQQTHNEFELDSDWVDFRIGHKALSIFLGTLELYAGQTEND